MQHWVGSNDGIEAINRFKLLSEDNHYIVQDSEGIPSIKEMVDVHLISNVLTFRDMRHLLPDRQDNDILELRLSGISSTERYTSNFSNRQSITKLSDDPILKNKSS